MLSKKLSCDSNNNVAILLSCDIENWIFDSKLIFFLHIFIFRVKCRFENFNLICFKLKL